jgi:isopentenyl-diphosphate delta-isomerase type 2
MDTVSTHSQQTSGIGFRKEKHLSICADASRFSVEGGSTGFDSIHFIHDALPEVAAEQVDLETEFLDHTVAAPIFISCMTGGSDRGFFANRELAKAAGEKRYPVGMGSIRILFDHPELFEQFHLKALAPEVPVLANIGGAQIRDEEHGRLFELVKKLEVDSLVVHLNPGQELFQPEGDRDFRGIRDSIARLCEGCPVPIIVKETGFGIRPSLVSDLLDRGVRYVDVAGAGGTNWVTVEAYRVPEQEREEASEFADWGLPTAMILACLGEHQGKILASGGVRSGLDVAKSIALGAHSAGLALPLIRQVVAGGADAVAAYLDRLENTLRSVMILTGSKTAAELRTGRIWLDPGFAGAVSAFQAADRLLSPIR